ncbi:unnamed protein product [Haemonchus placei]|uniref:Hydrolase_4 domain-containing protein n=1 Tax=Haemonchus placei TaxID=6290 RepID=A0A0N4W7S9_HAEPC|nr:unnamed protein product [Haemonchus placei]
MTIPCSNHGFFEGGISFDTILPHLIVSGARGGQLQLLKSYPEFWREEVALERMISLCRKRLHHSVAVPLRQVGDRRLSFENDERNEFAQAVLDSVDNFESPRLYFIGHSRGGENALQMATSPLNIKNVHGVIMLNSAGLRIHRGLEPFWKISITLRLLDLRVLNFFLHPLLYIVYNYALGLRVPSGSAAEAALRSMRTFALSRIMPCLDAINQNNQVRFLHAYSGSDFLIEAEVSKELASKLERRIELECAVPDSDEITRATIRAFSRGYQTVSVNFVKEGHFLQKFRAKYLVDVILTLIRM